MTNDKNFDPNKVLRQLLTPTLLQLTEVLAIAARGVCIVDEQFTNDYITEEIVSLIDNMSALEIRSVLEEAVKWLEFSDIVPPPASCLLPPD